jgi:DNA-binding transcriptional regulator YdaS (Cro superfamily)
MDKVAHYEECILKIANTSMTDSVLSGMKSNKQVMMNAVQNDKNSDKKNKVGAIAGGALGGAAKGILGTAATLGGAALLSKNKLAGVPKKYLKEMSTGALGAFNPAEVNNAMKGVRRFRSGNKLQKGLKIITNGKQIANDYGTKLGTGAAGVGAGLGALKAKKSYETAQDLKERSKTAAETEYNYQIEKTAIAASSLLRSAKQFVRPFAKQSGIKRVLQGAGVGAGIGALTAKPKTDENGNTNKDRLGGALTGAVTGGLLGGSIKPSLVAPKTKQAPKIIGAKVGNTAKSATDAAANVTSAVANNATNVKPKTISQFAHIDTLNPASNVVNIAENTAANVKPKTISQFAHIDTRNLKKPQNAFQSIY